MAILAGETRSPVRSVTRSVVIAAPIIALMFVLGTSTVVAYVPHDDIDLIGPVAQVLRDRLRAVRIRHPARDPGDPDDAGDAGRPGERGLHRGGAAADGRGLGPHAAGLVQPAAPTYQTPVNSILLVGVASLAIASLSLIGVGQAEAFQLLFNASGIFYAL